MKFPIISHVIIGAKGTGKTTFAINKWQRHLLFECGNLLNKIETHGTLANAINAAFGLKKRNFVSLIGEFQAAATDGYSIIIDNAELIDKEELCIILNSIISITVKTDFIFIFDVIADKIYNNEIFNYLLESDIIDWDVSPKNYTASQKNFYSYITDRLGPISSQVAEKIYALCNQNFNKLKSILSELRAYQSNFLSIDEFICKYALKQFSDKLADLKPELLIVLQKSSIIGEIFSRRVLENPNGYGIDGVKLLLDDLEKLGEYIMFLESSEEEYEFVSQNVHSNILNKIDTKQKIEWTNIVLRFYESELKKTRLYSERIAILLQINRLCNVLNNYSEQFDVLRSLLFEYSQMNDINQIINTLNKLLEVHRHTNYDEGLRLYFQFYKLYKLREKGFTKDALNEANNLYSNSLLENSLYTRFYLAICLFDIGDIDKSYYLTLDLCEKLQVTSAKSVENQPIYSLTYSLMATLLHHLGLGGEMEYYKKALNHSKNKFANKTLYYSILQKSDMFFDTKFSLPNLEESLNFFKKNNQLNEAAKTSMNLATEMMFTDQKYKDEVKEHLQYANEIFIHSSDERQAYVKNNLAIYYVLYENDFQQAINLIKSALFIGLSDFTNMTLYLNLCICYLNAFKQEDAKFRHYYAKFQSYYKKIKAREHSTQYEEQYNNILELLLYEYHGKTDRIIQRCNEILQKETPLFFKPIIMNIRERNNVNIEKKQTAYSDNNYFYATTNAKKIFLAEFRFWE